MKYTIGLILLTLSFVFLPYCQTSNTSLKSFLAFNKNIIVPSHMKHLINKASGMVFTQPKKQAFQLLSLFYDMELYNCVSGVSVGNSIKNVNLDFISELKPLGESSDEEVNENIVLLESSLSKVVELLMTLKNSHCSMDLKKRGKSVRRNIFLMTLKYLLI